MASMHAARISNSVDYHVGQRIKARRKSVNMSQKDLGDMLGVTFQQLQKYERGANRVSAGRLWKLSEALKVPIQYFYEGLKFARDAEVAEDGQAEFLHETDQSSDISALIEAQNRLNSADIRARLQVIIDQMSFPDKT